MKTLIPEWFPRKSNRDIHLEALKVLLSEEEHESILRAEARLLAILSVEQHPRAILSLLEQRFK